jgi:protoporphyrinogen/coproporphyrinogen III oxidase
LPSTDTGDVDVTVFEAAERVGGKIHATPFAGVAGVDEGPDAFLARVPEAVSLARRVGLGDDLVSPEAVGAAVWHDGLHPIPDGLMLGLPGKIVPLATTGLLSWRGKARAALEPFLPRTSTDSDSIGEFVRARFGDEVHERLVDSLVGSIYAADTDHFSLAEVPQLAALANGNRSVLLAARRQRRSQAGTATAASSPVFATPRSGIGALVEPPLTPSWPPAAGSAPVQTSRRSPRPATAAGRCPCRSATDPSPGGHDTSFDAVVFATPAGATATMLADHAPMRRRSSTAPRRPTSSW